jgi:hypothetical protein
VGCHFTPVTRAARLPSISDGMLQGRGWRQVLDLAVCDVDMSALES